MDVLDKLIDNTLFTSRCWLWQGACNTKGYGSIVLDGRRATFRVGTVHVVAWELLVEPLEADLQLDHLCLVKHCWNPDCLEPVDGMTNQRRRQGWYQTSDGSWFCSYDHEMTPVNLVQDGDKSRCRACRNATRRARYNPATRYF